MSDAIHLERCDPGRNLARFYRLELCQTLFGEVVLVRRWGRIGTRGRVFQSVMESQTDGERSLQYWHQKKHRRGYRAV
ncbi:WGR domain-containing protein [Rhodobacter sp. HX-7-19]|uniref:WGR domain-containing protein n=1 Tax=Paragemmobacter kunshanensis TaxID=2583234 RepID=A0A6M1TYM1_9RHOB|nr:WGR domain-containing protein [Rhodobacter kunshanensis]NGQ93330.1 WGR domain-containing protein [Rhodobacter kunshanensis]